MDEVEFSLAWSSLATGNGALCSNKELIEFTEFCRACSSLPSLAELGRV